MSSQALSAPAWVQNVSILQHQIFAILSKIIHDQDHIAKIFSTEAMNKYWIPAFTHKSVEPDKTKNYESMELFGDKLLNIIFLRYLRSLFGDELDQEKGTLLLNQYMSKLYQPVLTQKLGLDSLVRYDPAIPDISKEIQEDVFEAFFGALMLAADELVMPGLGYIYGYNLLVDIFQDIEINPDVQKDFKTQLKELFEKLQWGEVQYTSRNSDQPQLGEIKVEIRAPNGAVIGVGYGDQRSAQLNAAKAGLDYLASQGFTMEKATQQKLQKERARNAAFDLQYRRVEQAIGMLNREAGKKGKAQVTEFKVSLSSKEKVQGGTLYTYSVDVAYQVGNKLKWTSIISESGRESDTTKIGAMKKLADMWNIPQQI